MRVIIRNFKSVDHVELDLAPLTLLLGPPASGKSNILDVLALIVYYKSTRSMETLYPTSNH